MISKTSMRRLIAGLGIATLGMLGVACDDAPERGDKIDEDDGRFGPGDGVDEIGPFR